MHARASAKRKQGGGARQFGRRAVPPAKVRADDRVGFERSRLSFNTSAEFSRRRCRCRRLWRQGGVRSAAEDSGNYNHLRKARLTTIAINVRQVHNSAKSSPWRA